MTLLKLYLLHGPFLSVLYLSIGVSIDVVKLTSYISWPGIKAYLFYYTYQASHVSSCV